MWGGRGESEHFFVLIKTTEVFVWGWLIREKRVGVCDSDGEDLMSYIAVGST